MNFVEPSKSARVMESTIRNLFRLLLTLCAFFAPIAANAAEHLSLSADTINFYGDRFLLEADGNVSAVLDHQYIITGHTFSMDLRLNRFVIGGDVRVTGPGVDLHGAGIADFFESHRIYFVPMLTQPDRWTYLGTDFEHAYKGRQMPGDPFFLPDVSNSRVTVTARHVEIEPLSYMRFSSALVLSVAGRLPVPSYVVNFSNSPDFRQNSLAGAILDAGYDFAGGSHTLSSAHLRYDQENRLYGSIEQHYVAPGGFAVASINPLTRPVKQYNLIGLGRIGRQDQLYGFAQEITYQNAFQTPLQASAFANLQFTHVLRQSYVNISVNQNYQSLLGQPGGGRTFYGDLGHAWIPNHPVNVTIAWQGFDHNVGKLPLSFRLRTGAMMAHDNTYNGISNGLLVFSGQNVNTLYMRSFEALFYTKSIKLPHNLYFNASFDKQRQWFSLPHYIDSNYLNTSISRTFGTHLALYGGYTVFNIGDYYGAKQLQMYPPNTYVSPFDGNTYNGFAAFRGIATYRTLYASAVFAPNPDFTLNLLAKRNKDFPEPIPGVFGNPPYQIIGDLRVRVAAHATLDIQRTYNFNYPGQSWSPNFQIQVLP